MSVCDAELDIAVLQAETLKRIVNLARMHHTGASEPGLPLNYHDLQSPRALALCRPTRE